MEPEMNMTLTESGARTLLSAVDTALRVWPGGDPQEQHDLQQAQVVLRSVVLEFDLMR